MSRVVVTFLVPVYVVVDTIAKDTVDVILDSPAAIVDPINPPHYHDSDRPMRGETASLALGIAKSGAWPSWLEPVQ